MKSGAGPADYPDDGLAELALVGRSNVGKSTLVNALTGIRLARTSRAAGKTRLLNVYRLQDGPTRPFHMVDLPGYGYARGGEKSQLDGSAAVQAYPAASDRRADCLFVYQNRSAVRCLMTNLSCLAHLRLWLIDHSRGRMNRRSLADPTLSA